MCCHYNSPLASAEAPRSPFARLLLLVLVELVLLLGEDMDGRFWLRKTPGAMGCSPPGDLTVPVLNSWSVRLPSWESRLCSGELLSWEIFGGSSITIAFFLVLFFFFLVFCCSSYWHIILLSWANRILTINIKKLLLTNSPDEKALLQQQPGPFLWRPLGLHLLPAFPVEEPRVLHGLWRDVCKYLNDKNFKVEHSFVIYYPTVFTCRAVWSVVTAFPFFRSGFENRIILFRLQRGVN